MNKAFRVVLSSSLFILLCSLAVSSPAQTESSRHGSNSHVGPGNVIVTPKFGGTILGFDIDQNGTEGLFSESFSAGCGYATETFDQKTGDIIKVLSKGSGCGDDEVTRGIVGNSIGLVEHDHEIKFDDFDATYRLVSPVSANQFNGSWTPPGA